MTREIRDQQLFNQIAQAYTQKDLTPSAIIARQYRVMCVVESILKTTANLGVIVDLGCGVGAPAKYLHGHYQQYIGVDQSAELITAAETFTRDLPLVKFVVGNAKDTSLPDNTADLILSVGALHHMTDLDAVFQEMRRISKPGARLAVIEPQNGNPIIQIMRWLRARLDGSYSEEQIYFSEASLRELFLRNHIENVQTNYYGYASTPFAQVILNPQSITTSLSYHSVNLDKWLTKHLPTSLRKFSFDVAVSGSFPSNRN